MTSSRLTSGLASGLTALALLLVAGCSMGASTTSALVRPAAVDETVVATASGAQLASYLSPEATQPFLVLGRTTALGSPTVVLVQAVRPGWLQVLLPNRPNGLTGWVHRAEVTLSRVRYRVRVSLAARQLVVYRDGVELLRTPAAVGAAATPTPSGLFFLTDIVAVSAGQPAYGPYALGLSGHSPVLARFGDGDAQIALHGSDDPASLGQPVSHGCIRIGNVQIRELAQMLPLGSPVQIDAG